MDLSLRSFILVIGLVVMAFILWDGIKKVKQSRANRLRIKLDDQFDDVSDSELLGSEFPNGGARTLGQTARDTSSDSALNTTLEEELYADKYREFEFDSAALNREGEDDFLPDNLLQEVESELADIDERVDGQLFEQANQAEEATALANDVFESETVLEGESVVEVDEVDEPKLTESLTMDSIVTRNDKQDPPIVLALEAEDDSDTLVAKRNEPISVSKTEKPSSANTKAHGSDSFTDHSEAVDKIDSIKAEREKAPTPEQRAEKLKAELDKINAAKKQVAAKQAYEDAKLQAKSERDQGSSQIKNQDKEQRISQNKDLSPKELNNKKDSHAKSVPMLMDPVELGGVVDPNPPQQKELVLPDQVEVKPKAEIELVEDENVFESFSAMDEDAIDENRAENSVITSLDPLFDDVPTKDSEQTVVGERLRDRQPAQEVLVINVLKDDGQPLLGRDLKHVFKVCDLRFGEMDIFHRFEQANAKGKIQFSVANGVEPGTFDPATLETIETTSISCFMSLPGPEHPMEAFDAMLEVAHVFARNFNAELHDESHSDLTPQTIEHCRNRIREFSRKQKMKATKA